MNEKLHKDIIEQNSPNGKIVSKKISGHILKKENRGYRVKYNEMTKPLTEDYTSNYVNPN